MIRLQAVTKGALLAPWRRLRASWLLLRGRVAEAESVLRYAAAAAPRSFRTWLAWARVLLALGREAESRGALRRCYRLSPTRFLDSDLPARFRELVPLECELPALFGAARQPADEATEASAGADSNDDALLAADPPPPGTDFRDGAEWRRFQALRPLANTDAKDVDWDALLRKLTSPSQSGETGRT